MLYNRKEAYPASFQMLLAQLEILITTKGDKFAQYTAQKTITTVIT